MAIKEVQSGEGWALLGATAAVASEETSGRHPCVELQRQEGTRHAEPQGGDTVSKAPSHTVLLKPFLNPAVKVLSPHCTVEELSPVG